MSEPITAAIDNPQDWPAEKQTVQLRLQLQLLHGWAEQLNGTPARHAAGA